MPNVSGKELVDTRLFGDLPEVLLPSQFFEMIGRQALSSEQRLLFAVLIDAINVVRDYRVCPSERRRTIFNEASSWLFSQGIEGPMSFVHVCEALGIDANSLRTRLKEFALGQNGASLVRLRLKESGRAQRVVFRRDRRAKRGSTKLTTRATLAAKP